MTHHESHAKAQLFEIIEPLKPSHVYTQTKSSWHFNGLDCCSSKLRWSPGGVVFPCSQIRTLLKGNVPEGVSFPASLDLRRRLLTWQVLSSQFRFLKEGIIIQPQAIPEANIFCWKGLNWFTWQKAKVYYLCFRSSNRTWEWALHGPFVPNVIYFICYRFEWNGSSHLTYHYLWKNEDQGIGVVMLVPHVEKVCQIHSRVKTTLN